MEIRKIAVPIDFSDSATETIAAACDLASRYDSELSLLNVVEPWPAAAMASTEPYPIEPAERQLWAVPLPNEKPRVVHRSVRVGEAVAEILKYAEDKHIDLIVMGSHGRTGFSHLFLGSVAEAVVRRARCPVMVIRPRPPALAQPHVPAAETAATSH